LPNIYYFQAGALLFCASLVAAWLLVIAWVSGIMADNHNLASHQGRINSADESLNRILAQLHSTPSKLP